MHASTQLLTSFFVHACKHRTIHSPSNRWWPVYPFYCARSLVYAGDEGRDAAGHKARPHGRLLAHRREVACDLHGQVRDPGHRAEARSCWRSLHGRVRHAERSLASPPPYFRKVRPAMLSACHCLSPRHAAAGAQALCPRHVAATCVKTVFQNWFGPLLIHLVSRDLKIWF